MFSLALLSAFCFLFNVAVAAPSPPPHQPKRPDTQQPANQAQSISPSATLAHQHESREAVKQKIQGIDSLSPFAVHFRSLNPVFDFFPRRIMFKLSASPDGYEGDGRDGTNLNAHIIRHHNLFANSFDPFELFRQRTADPGSSLSDFVQSFSNLGNINDHALDIPSLMGKLLAGNDADTASPKFDYTPDKHFLLVNVSMPSASDPSGSNVEHRIRAAVIGDGGHLRLKIEKTAHGGASFSSLRIFSLPVRVTDEEIDLGTNEDGSITIRLKIIGEKSSHGSTSSVKEKQIAFKQSERQNLKASSSGSSVRSSDNESSGEKNDGDQTSPSDNISNISRLQAVRECQRRYLGAGYRLLAKQCVCKAKMTEPVRAMCFGSVLSSALRIARQLNMNDFATDAKHTAIDCAYKDVKDTCLEAITDQALRVIYGDVAHGEQKELPDRIRAVLESEDFAPAEKQSRPWLMNLIALLILVGAMFLTFSVGLFKARQLMGISGGRSVNPEDSRMVGSRGRGARASMLSGVLSQPISSGTGSNSSGSTGISNAQRVLSKQA